MQAASASAARWWRGLVHRAVRAPSLCAHGASGAGGWRVTLRARAQRMHAYHRRGFWRCKRSYLHPSAQTRAIFAAWRLLARIELLDERCVSLEAREPSLHSTAGAWWTLP